MSKKANLAILVAGLAGLFFVISRKTLTLPGAALSSTAVANLALETKATYFAKVPIDMLRAIAEIESGRNPLAVRFEPHVGDASIGLMQTLLGTARWLATDMGATAFGVPDAQDLLDARTSMYFGAAYLDWLFDWNGAKHSEEWIVRSYNGGPGNVSTATDNYWRKYQVALSNLQGGI